MENCNVVDQKFAALVEFIEDRSSLFARQGSVVQSWRVHRGRKTGPYYRLAFREGGRQRSIYLGGSDQRADRVRAVLVALQTPAKFNRTLQRARAAAKVELRKHKQNLDQQLRQQGLFLKGFEVRGWSKDARWPSSRVGSLSQSKTQEANSK